MRTTKRKTNAQRLPYAFRFLEEQSRYKALYGGRGSGKSHSVAHTLVTRGARSPKRILCAREIQKSITASVKRLLDDKIAECGLRKFYKSTKYSITAPNGTEFMFAGLKSDPYAIKSAEGIDIAWIEEANTVSQASLDNLIPTIRKKNSELWFVWNRRFTTDPVDRMFLSKEGAPPNSIIINANWDDNPWFPDVLRDEMEWDRRRDRDKWLHVWEGHPIVHSEARVFQNWVVEDLDDQLPKDAVPRLGADWGFSKDPTVLVEAYIWGRTMYISKEAYKVKCEIDEIPSLFAGTDPRHPRRWENKNNHKGISTALKYTITADSSRPDTVSYMKNRGFDIRSARKGPGSIEDGIEFMKSFDIVVHPDCLHSQNELAYYSYKEDPQTGEILPELKDTDNHVIDALRYACEAVRRRKRKKSLHAPAIIQLR